MRSEPNGDRLALQPHGVDLFRFRAGIAEGRRLAADGKPKQAAEAVKEYEQALALYRRLGSRRGEARVLDNLGVVHTSLGRPDRAGAHHGEALEIFREIGETYGEAWALNGLGEAALAAGRAEEALSRHAEALAVAGRDGVPDQAARAHTGLGRAHRSLGDLEGARRHITEALNRHTELRSPDTDQVREELAALDALEGLAARE